jgi:toxin-antitoxin system PIN domain toxin
MTFAVLDVNVLLALAWPNHQHHDRAHEWFLRESSYGWATCALTQLAFVRLSSNPAYTPAAVTPAEAAALLIALTSHVAHRILSELPPVAVELFARAAGHRQTTDAYLVHLAEHHAGRIVTFDAPMRQHARNGEAVTVIGV